MKKSIPLCFLVLLLSIGILVQAQEVKKKANQPTLQKTQKQVEIKEQKTGTVHPVVKPKTQPQIENLQTKRKVMINPPIVATDYDGNVYKTITIGDQIWMADNLKTTHYSDGTEITEGIYTYSDNVLPAFGKLYNWYTAMQRKQGIGNNTPTGKHQGICPDGWHIPAKEEWHALINHLGGSEVAGGKLKEAGTDHWRSPNVGATNESGFNAMPAGWMYSSGGGTNLGSSAIFWSKQSGGGPVSGSGPKAWKMGLNHNNTVAWVASIDKMNAYSVRCIKD